MMVHGFDLLAENGAKLILPSTRKLLIVLAIEHAAEDTWVQVKRRAGLENVVWAFG